MKRFKFIAPIALLALMLLLVAVTAWASSEGGHGGGHAEGEHALPWGNLMWRGINFVLFVGIIWYAAGAKLKAFFGGRKSGIENELTELDTRKTEAEKKLKEVEQSIANLDAERQSILADYKAQGEALKASIIEKAEASATQIREQAKVGAENEAKYAIEAMRSELADMIVEAAQKVLEKKLTKEEHEKLVDKYLTKVVLN